MNLKERGITIGDLTILFIIICSLFIINKTKDSKTQKQISNSYQLEILKNFNE